MVLTEITFLSASDALVCVMLLTNCRHANTLNKVGELKIIAATSAC